jgi:predicted DNA-binding transcriptional regulator AlpA
MSHIGKRGDGSRKKKRRTVRIDGRYLTNKALAQYAGVSLMTIWRWKHDPELNFPLAALIGNIEHNDRQAFDRWMKKRPTRQLTAENSEEATAA